MTRIWTLPSGVITEDGTLDGPAGALKAAAAVEGHLRAEAAAALRKRIHFAVGALSVGLIAGAALYLYGQVLAASLPPALAVFYSVTLFLVSRKTRSVERVTDVATVYWVTLALPAGPDRAMLYDVSGCLPYQTLELPTLKHPERVVELRNRLDGLDQELAAFESPNRRIELSDHILYGTDADFGALLADLTGVLDDVENHRVSVSLVPDSSPVVSAIEALQDLYTDQTAGPAVIAPWERSLSQVHDEVLGLYEMSSAEAHADLDSTLDELEDLLDELLTKLELAHAKSLAVINEIHTLATHTTTWPGQTSFCPLCNAPSEEGELGALARSTALILNLEPDSDPLYCPVCGNAIADERAINISRFKQEVFDPLFDQIYGSVREEVLRIDRGIEDKLLDLEKEQSVVLQEARRSVNQERRNRLMRLRENEFEAISLETRVSSIAGHLAEYKRLEKERCSEFQRECEEARIRVEETIRELEKAIEEQFAASEARAERESARIDQMNRIEEQSRHRELMEVQRQSQEVFQEGIRQVTEGQQLTREEIKRNTEAHLMRDKEKEAVRRKNVFDSINPVKLHKIKKARRAGRKHRENLG